MVTHMTNVEEFTYSQPDPMDVACIEMTSCYFQVICQLVFKTRADRQVDINSIFQPSSDRHRYRSANNEGSIVMSLTCLASPL
ncbi:hypothetical protein J6590_035292 [Homalodisca vitripennis]|nr:hypothetical protein J6590_035292 [Homalodisca vitripennis]